MLRKNPKTHTVIDMYIAWTKQVLIDNPGFTVGYDYLSKIAKVKVVYNKEKVMFMTYTMFRCIIETYNKNVAQAIIDGQRFDLGSRLGYIFPARIERNYKKPVANMYATVAARKKDPNSAVVYFTDEEYLMVKWQKMYRTRNESVYRFTVAKHSMRRQFSEANMGNPMLRSIYKYYPYIKTSA